jgi:phosphatidylinositol alpha-1,6-mannosyltransferase
MKLLWITADFYPDIGGLQTYTARLTELLAVRHHVGLVINKNQELPPQLQNRVEHFTCPGLSGTRIRWNWDRARSRLERIIETFGPDLIHLANAGMAVYWDILPTHIPWIASVHGNDLTSPWQLTPGRDVNETIVEGLERCSSIIAVSSYIAQRIRDRNVSVPLKILPNTCDIRVFYPLRMNKHEFLQSYRIPSHVPILLTTGRLAPRKGHLVIVEALARLKSPFHWIIVGDGKSRAVIGKMIKRFGLRESTTMVGWVSQAHLVQMYNACDIFLLTPLVFQWGARVDSEGFGIVYHEANACGKVLDGHTGVLVPPDDPAALADALEKLLEYPQLARDMGKRGLEYVRSLGGWLGVVTKIEEIYRESIAGPNPTLVAVPDIP